MVYKTKGVFVQSYKGFDIFATDNPRDRSRLGPVYAITFDGKTRYLQWLTVEGVRRHIDQRLTDPEFDAKFKEFDARWERRANGRRKKITAVTT
jgi:hypothetical protein